MVVFPWRLISNFHPLNLFEYKKLQHIRPECNIHIMQEVDYNYHENDANKKNCLFFSKSHFSTDFIKNYFNQMKID
jgi:hypothetical protein